MRESLSSMLESTKSEVRTSPQDASARMRLFRLFVVGGEWDRARNQLDTASNLDASLAFTATVYRMALGCEALRAEVFAGKRTPLVAGEPSQWLALMVESLRAADAHAASALRAEALEAAQAKPGALNGEAFEWISDADSRLGPTCECFIDGKYYWVPFERVSEIRIPEPNDVLDTVWASAELTFVGGGTKHALIPVRYPGTESSDDEDLRLARKTVWAGSEDTGWQGLGQRTWTTDRAEVGVLDARSLTFD